MLTETASTPPGSAPPTVLQLQGITKRFGTLVANDAISLTLQRGEIVALLGENGAGKSTLMSILFGHYAADAGHIEVFGQPCRASRAPRWPPASAWCTSTALADNLPCSTTSWLAARRWPG
jgi:ABC-type transporter Mla maintaining outer membrane lipid asymmetry ATPase subunit MlaF